MDWIGVEHYPTVAHFLEEVRAQGLSRRIRKNFDFSTLGPQSKIICVHRDAIITNPKIITGRKVLRCPKTLLPHNEIGFISEPIGCAIRLANDCEYPHRTGVKKLDAKMKFMNPKGIDCMGLWWHDVPEEYSGGSNDQGHLTVPLAGGGNFSAHARKEGVEHAPGVFALFPIARITVVETPADKNIGISRAEKISRMTEVPVTLADTSALRSSR
jgi:hypothetical protein